MILPVVRERLERLLRLSAVEGALGALHSRESKIQFSGLQPTAKALLATYLAGELRRPAFFLVASNKQAESIAETLRFFASVFSAGNVAVLPAFDTLPWDARSPHADILERRAATLFRLATGQASFVVAPVSAALWRYRSHDSYEILTRTLKTDDEVSLDAFIAYLGAVGYARTEMVEMPGQFAQRGGIVDIFSPEAPRPVRVELLGDTVESVREFDPRTQRSIAPVNWTTVLPLTEWAVAQAEGTEAWALPTYWGPAGVIGTRSLFELTPSSLEPVVFLDEPATLRPAVDAWLGQATEWYEKLGTGTAPEARTFYWQADEFDLALQLATRVELEQLGMSVSDAARFSLSSRPSTRFHGDVVACVGDVKSQLASGGTVYLTAASTGELERYADICREYEVPYVLGESENAAAGFTAEGALESAGLVLVRAPFGGVTTFPDAKLTIFGNADLFDVAPSVERPTRKIRTSGFFSDFADLKPSDFVVHVDHGIGQFEGLRQIESDGRRGEFMLLRYAEDSRLYVPLERMDLVQSYRVVEGAEPPLDKLGGTAWTTRKARVRKSLEDMADKLLELYASRKSAKGFAFTPDGHWQREFEDAFEFEETNDQNAAIADIKRDMERETPMDRLLCGDVGYGETEVAMRAAFKVIGD